MTSTLRIALLLVLMVMILHDTDAWRRRRRRRRSPPPCHRRDCQVSGWTAWSACNHKCGSSGIQHRTRSKTVSEACGGRCPYHFREQRGCNRNACQNGGIPQPGSCKCTTGFTGTCCETAPKGRKCGNGTMPLNGCSRRGYSKIGAYRDRVIDRAMPVLLLTYRDCTAKENDGHKVDWRKFTNSIHSLACSCAKLARLRGWKVFGLQNYGECWSGPSAESTYSKYGEVGPSSAVQFVSKLPLPPCDSKNPQECVGKPDVNYVYRVNPE